MSTGGFIAAGGEVGEVPGATLGLAESSPSAASTQTHTPARPTQQRHHVRVGRRARTGVNRNAEIVADIRRFEPTPRPPKRHAQWFSQYQRALVVLDFLAASLAVSLSFLFRFGADATTANGRFYSALAALTPLAWVLLVAVNRAYEDRFVGVGSAEFSRVFQAFLHLTALIAFTSFVTKADLARGFVLIALPLALIFDLLVRYGARKWLHRQRARGMALTSVLVVGDAAAIESFTTMVRRDQYAGLRVVGACVPDEVVMELGTVETLAALEVPLLGDVDSVRSAVQRSKADTVAVVSSGVVGPEKLRWISWQLEGTATDLVVSPGLTEVAGPRLHIRPVAGLPLLHVEEPEFTGFRRVMKGMFDRSVAAVALLLLSPLFIALAISVRRNSRGPALFRQVRVGREGSTFEMIKFRSMYVDAEERLADLVGQSDHGEGVLFKMKDDPRVTSVGRFLRKYSLDELPQLINVLNGTMSLVGPRPPLPREVARYEDHVHRRLLVKPGVTGLWQVSGRSDLSWEESVRLDLRYVENWSLSEDLMILWKTARAVTAGSGAY
ncbi:sugar transferase [Jatrophihabitans telluris]|uniref:Sugar transferase n=1 Tax=Jatrophihabitans telluris TaxID=2038343 RepID=A0ABY4R1Z9_9ACTN|nr:sugar transferase [Jatrophihabitans telluris]UQX89352.1 sugar transferase [Jatrophihabitans telluris]